MTQPKNFRMRISFNLFCGLVGSLVASTTVVDDRPKVLIMADDIGYETVSSYGSADYAPSPGLMLWRRPVYDSLRRILNRFAPRLGCRS